MQYFGCKFIKFYFKLIDLVNVEKMKSIMTN